jgi:hypothetical protein
VRPLASRFETICPGRIAIHSVGQGEVGFYSPTRRPDAQLVDHLLQDRLQIDLSPVREREAAAEAAARKV